MVLAAVWRMMLQSGDGSDGGDGGDGKDGRHNRNAPDGHDEFVSDAARHKAALRMARQFDRITG